MYNKIRRPDIGPGHKLPHVRLLAKISTKERPNVGTCKNLLKKTAEKIKRLEVETTSNEIAGLFNIFTTLQPGFGVFCP